jgi:restriction system protein
MLPVLNEASAGEIKIGDVVVILAQKLNLTGEQTAALLPSGRQTVFANRVHWAKTYLAKAGLVEATKRGHFQITARGQEVLQKNPQRIDIAYLGQFPEFILFRERSEPSPEVLAGVHLPQVSEETPDEIIRSAHAQIELALAQDILDRVRAAPPEFFERLIVSLLLAMGYGGSAQDAGRAIGKSGDDGVDGVVDQDALGLDRVYVQAKRYAATNTVGSSAIRDFFGSLDRHKASKGLFVTTSNFTSSARETADYLSKRIVLIDGNLLAKLMIRHNVGCRIEETLHLKKLDEDFFD